MNLLFILASFLDITIFGSAYPTNSTSVEARWDVNPICYNCGFGPSGEVMDQAIEWFCTKYANARINQYNIDGGILALSDTFLYAATPDTHEHGTILMEILAQPFALCGTQVISHDTCLYNFYVPVNGCNQNGVDNKQGGIWEVPCTAYMINPNPGGC